MSKSRRLWLPHSDYGTHHHRVTRKHSPSLFRRRRVFFFKLLNKRTNIRTNPLTTRLFPNVLISTVRAVRHKAQDEGEKGVWRREDQLKLFLHAPKTQVPTQHSHANARPKDAGREGEREIRRELKTPSIPLHLLLPLPLQSKAGRQTKAFAQH